MGAEQKKFKVGDKVVLIADNAEYGSKGDEGVIASPAKFKVGDRVRALVDWGNIQKGQIYTIPHLDEDGEVWVTPDGAGGWDDYLTNSELELVTAQATTPAIVALIENGVAKPAFEPKVHASEADATVEAERLAGMYRGQRFGIFVLSDTREADIPTYDHEWKNFAARGEKIRAIKVLRAITGMGLKPAKDAVEYFLAAA